MVADERTKEAAIIDPQRDIDIYLQDASERGFKIKWVILTHFHADFVAGHIELARPRRSRNRARCEGGSRIRPSQTRRRRPDPVRKRSSRRGSRPRATRPEGLTILAYDVDRDADKPYAAFTGDTLFIGDVGRSGNLMASIGFKADELAAMLYESLHNKMKRIP